MTASSSRMTVDAIMGSGLLLTLGLPNAHVRDASRSPECQCLVWPREIVDWLAAVVHRRRLTLGSTLITSVRLNFTGLPSLTAGWYCQRFAAASSTTS